MIINLIILVYFFVRFQYKFPIDTFKKFAKECINNIIKLKDKNT